MSALPIHVLIVDDHPAMIEAISRVLAADPNISVGGSARSRAEAEIAISTLDPDVVVCDIQMGGEADGLRLLEGTGRRNRPLFLMLSAFDYPSLFRAAFERGAVGYLLKTAELADIVAAVKTVASGATAFSAASMRIVHAAPRRPSDREVEVLHLVVSGRTNDEIAAQLFLSQDGRKPSPTAVRPLRRPEPYRACGPGAPRGVDRSSVGRIVDTHDHPAIARGCRS